MEIDDRIKDVLINALFDVDDALALDEATLEYWRDRIVRGDSRLS